MLLLIKLLTSVMNNPSDTKTSENLPENLRQQSLTPDGQRLKEQLSHIPFWKERAKDDNCFWNNLGSSHVNL